MNFEVLKDRSGSKYLVIYEEGNLNKPILMLSDFQVENIIKRWSE